MRDRKSTGSAKKAAEGNSKNGCKGEEKRLRRGRKTKKGGEKGVERRKARIEKEKKRNARRENGEKRGEVRKE